jgi:acyl-CoA reductase-like NAD-dependent aldehyde dehydrogenase
MISAIAEAARRWSDRSFPPRVLAAQRISDRMAYSAPMVDFALDALFGSITEEGLRETIAAETGGVATEPLGSVAIISSRTTIGVAIVPAIFAIAAGCEVLVKDREDHLVAAFFATLREPVRLGRKRPARGDRAFRAETWDGAGGVQDLSRFDAVVAFGTTETLDAIQRQLPATTRFIAYGPKASIGYVSREHLSSEASVQRIAAGAARDLVLYEGEGCLSLRALFVERGAIISPERFAAFFASAIERAGMDFPLHTARTRDIVSRMNARDLAAFRGTLLASDRDASYVLEAGEPDRAPAFLPRVLALHAVTSHEEMDAYVARHRIPIELRAGEGGVRFGGMQTPPLGYRHGGRPRIAEFARTREFAT